MAAIRTECGFADSFAFHHLVTSWADFVSLLEKDTYSMSLSDYLHALELRDLVEAAKSRFPARFAAELEVFLQPLDERFRFATSPVRDAIGGERDPDSFWWWRLPRNATDEFLDELANQW